MKTPPFPRLALTMGLNRIFVKTSSTLKKPAGYLGGGGCWFSPMSHPQQTKRQVQFQAQMQNFIIKLKICRFDFIGKNT